MPKTQSTEEKAQALLAGLDKDVERLQKNVDRSTQAVHDLAKTLSEQFNELVTAIRERNWAAGHPAFKEEPILLLEPVSGSWTFTQFAGADVVQEPEAPVITPSEGEPTSGILTQAEVDAKRAATSVEAVAQQAPAKPVESGLIAAKILAANAAAGTKQVDPFANFK